MSDSDNWVDNNSELAVDEDSELDIVNNETFADIVDLDYAWEEQHQLAASQLEREKVQQRLVQSSTPEVDKEFRMLSLQARGSQGLGTDIRNEVDSFTVSGGKEPLFSSERWDKNLFENDREVAVEQQLRQTPWKTEWLSRRPKKVLFAQDLERSLLENTSQGRTLPGKNNTTKSSLEPVTKTERMEFLDEVFAREFPRLESELVSAQDDRKKTVSSMPSNRFRRSQDTSSGQRPKRTGYYRKGDNRQFIRRLYSKWMTCSEIELIAKMHIRQLETASWPVEDFYCQAFQQKKQKKSEERLKEYSKPLDPKKRILKNRYFPHHSENNLKLLKRALGSIQGYNPNAPRRIVQVANEPVSDNVLEKEESFRGDTLLHEDSRVTAQSAIALAFDILFDWEDGLFSCTSAVELEEFKARMSRRLLSAFGISVEEGLRDEGRNIFSRVCTLPKVWLSRNIALE